MLKVIRVLAIGSLLFVTGTVFGHEPIAKSSQAAVEETERAFADTMARRDFEKFKTFLSEDAVFFSGTASLRGRQQIADTWESYFKDPVAPFSWEPEHVEVLDSGSLAWSSGPVYDANGKKVATFNSVWQRDASNQWRIVFDKGNDVCNCP